jgi:UTP:GlnB (protein PII) uridylyltransferase
MAYNRIVPILISVLQFVWLFIAALTNLLLLGMQGLRVELRMNDRVGLLSDITRIFRENGLSVAHADVTTQDDQAVNVFYVIDASGCPVDMKVVEAMRKSIGHATLQVKGLPR